MYGFDSGCLTARLNAGFWYYSATLESGNCHMVNLHSDLRFSLARLPRVEFGKGSFNQLVPAIAGFGQSVLLVTGAQSFSQSARWQPLLTRLSEQGITYLHAAIPGEPSPELIDDIVSQFADLTVDVVVAVGGGSALDAGKAIAGLLKVKRSVMDYLEGVGPELDYEGPAVPFIAVPTTAGTGSEATKNAVLSRQDLDGFKKSFRDEKLVAELAIIDPDLLETCPPAVIAANGMDALTQLIESYVSIKANRFNDALGESGLRAARDGLVRLFKTRGQDEKARENMAFASLVSGINLAQTGLGSVHGLASPLGAFYPIPHGVVCGTLVAIATRVNIEAMQQRDPDNAALQRYAKVAALLMQRHFASQDEALSDLVALLESWTETLGIPRLSAYGLKADGIDHVVRHSRGSSMKTNPIVLTDDEIALIVSERL
jgi:alcohol dehydrogenase class IV